jgi:hypothetical protein
MIVNEKLEGFGSKDKGKRQSRQSKDNIKIDFMEIVCFPVDWIHLH